MPDLPPVGRALDQIQIPYRLFVHAGPVHSLEQAARERNHLPDQVIRSIVFRVGKAEFLMALSAGVRQVGCFAFQLSDFAWLLARSELSQERRRHDSSDIRLCASLFCVTRRWKNASPTWKEGHIATVAGNVPVHIDVIGLDDIQSSHCGADFTACN